jgi:opacity protein-like surface antigen
MKRCSLVVLLAVGLVACLPAPAAADVTVFWGVSPSPATRPGRGISIGLGLLVIGFEFEYAKLSEDEVEGAPGLTTGMGNIMIQTPTSKLQLYATTGGGVYRESWRDFNTTHVGTNLGGGAKIGLAGPLRIRLDYRVFNLNGTPITKRVQRFYGGVNLAF